jgi:hypothetical protein
MSFMPEIFDACVEKIIVGGKDDAGDPDPYMMTFVFKKGFGPTLQSEKRDLQGKSHTPILHVRPLLAARHVRPDGGRRAPKGPEGFHQDRGGRRFQLIFTS